jgi:hypothetical protein
VKFCTKCGTQNDETASFCKNCGGSLADNNVSSTINSQTQFEDVANNQTVSAQEPINSTIQSNAISSQNNYNTGSSNSNEKSVGLAILGFLIPLVGIILFFAMKKDKPGKAKSALKGALICIILSFLVGLIMVLIPIIKGIGSSTNNTQNTSSNSNVNSSTNNNIKEDIIGYWANKDKTIIFTISKAESSISSGEYYMELLGEGNFVTSNSVTFTDKTITNGSTIYKYTITNEELLLNNGAEIKLYKITESEFKTLEAKIISSISGSSSSY